MFNKKLVLVLSLVFCFSFFSLGVLGQNVIEETPIEPSETMGPADIPMEELPEEYGEKSGADTERPEPLLGGKETTTKQLTCQHRWAGKWRKTTKCVKEPKCGNNYVQIGDEEECEVLKTTVTKRELSRGTRVRAKIKNQGDTTIEGKVIIHFVPKEYPKSSVGPPEINWLCIRSGTPGNYVCESNEINGCDNYAGLECIKEHIETWCPCGAVVATRKTFNVGGSKLFSKIVDTSLLEDYEVKVEVIPIEEVTSPSMKIVKKTQVRKTETTTISNLKKRWIGIRRALSIFRKKTAAMILPAE